MKCVFNVYIMYLAIPEESHIFGLHSDTMLNCH